MSIDLVADEFGLLHAAVPHPRLPGTNVQVMVLKAEDGWWAYVDGQRVDGQFRSAQQAKRAAAKEIKALPGAAAAVVPLAEESVITAPPRPAFQPVKRNPRVPFAVARASFALIFFAVTAVVVHATGLLDRTMSGPAVTAAPVPPAVWSFVARDDQGDQQDRYDKSHGELRMTAALTNAAANEVAEVIPMGRARYKVIPAGSDSLAEFITPRSGNQPFAASPSSATFARLRVEDQSGEGSYSGNDPVEDEATQDDTINGPALDRQPPTAGKDRTSRATRSAARLRQRASRDRLRRRSARLRAIRRSRVRKVRRRRSSRHRAAIRRDRRRKIQSAYRQAFRLAD